MSCMVADTTSVLFHKKISMYTYSFKHLGMIHMRKELSTTITGTSRKKPLPSFNMNKQADLFDGTAN